MYPNFSIAKRLEHFPQPPCQPPKGKDVLERYFDVLYRQPANNRKATEAAQTVALELQSLWQRGDARIPLRTTPTLKKAILDFRDDLLYIKNESKKSRPAYQEKVRAQTILKEREREGEGEGERERGKERERQTDRQGDTHTATEKQRDRKSQTK